MAKKKDATTDPLLTMLMQHKGPFLAHTWCKPLGLTVQELEERLLAEGVAFRKTNPRTWVSE